MKKWLISLVITASTTIFTSPPTAAEDSGWKLPNLNPFSSSTQKSPPSASKYTSSPPTSGWKMPKLWPSGAITKSATNQPSTLQKMTTGTKNIISKTTSALNPTADTKAKQPPPKITGSKSVFSQASAKKKDGQPQSSSLIPSWPWSGKDEEKEKRPKTVSDFLAQPRPGY